MPLEPFARAIPAAAVESPTAQGSTGRSLLNREDAGLILLLFATVALFAAFKIGYLRAARYHPEQLVPIFACICVMSLAFAGLRYGQLHPGFSLLLRGISLSLGVYVAASWTGMSSGSPALILTMDVVRYASLAAVAASMVRPSFAMIPCVYVLVNKDVTQHALQLSWLTRTDYLPVVELGIFMTFGVIVVHLLSWLAKRGALFRSSGFAGVADARSSSVALLLMAVAIHFGNYFWSAMAKILLDGGPLDWMLENKTHLLTATAYATGNLPLGHSRELSDSVFAMLSQVYVPLNIATLVAQLVSVVAIIRIRSAIAITAFYDVTHVVIFVVTGIFFWKWILLNTVLVFALSRVREAEVRPILRVIGPLFVAGGTVVFFAARLGWYETPALNDHHFEAETETGTRYRVPTNYFLAASVTVAQQRLGSPTTAVFPSARMGNDAQPRSAPDGRARMRSTAAGRASCLPRPRRADPPPRAAASRAHPGPFGRRWSRALRLVSTPHLVEPMDVPGLQPAGQAHDSALLVCRRAEVRRHTGTSASAARSRTL